MLLMCEKIFDRLALWGSVWQDLKSLKISCRYPAPKGNQGFCTPIWYVLVWDLIICFVIKVNFIYYKISLKNLDFEALSSVIFFFSRSDIVTLKTEILESGENSLERPERPGVDFINCFAPYLRLAPNFWEAFYWRRARSGPCAQLLKSYLYICALRPTFMKSTPDHNALFRSQSGPSQPKKYI